MKQRTVDCQKLLLQEYFFQVIIYLNDVKKFDIHIYEKLLVLGVVVVLQLGKDSDKIRLMCSRIKDGFICTFS